MPKRQLRIVSIKEKTCNVNENHDSDDDELMVPRKRNKNRIIFDSDSDGDNGNDSANECDAGVDIAAMLTELLIEEESENNNARENIIEQSEWKEFSGKQKLFSYTGTGGLLKELPDSISPYEVFSLCIDDEIINLLVTETNRYAEQKINKSEVTPSSRLRQWTPTNAEEIRQFLGILLWMGLVKAEPMANYWSTKPIYNFHLPSSIMTRNRFELLLSNLHFADNNTILKTDRLGKISPLLNMLQNKYQGIFSPGEDIVIDETLVPWRGRLIFKQYIPNKAHKYGIKLFKLCSPEGYTWSIKIYSGKSADGVRETGLAHNVCLELASKLLEQGRTLYIDNFYTSYELALSCLKQKTHVVGTVRNNKKFIPKDILQYPLKKGEMVSKEDDNGVVILKWRDIRDVRMLSTKHAPIIVPNPKNIHSGDIASTSHRSSNKLKPLAVWAYNKGKCGIDLSDQMVSYATSIRKGIKWSRKLGIQLILGISVVNALVVYKIATHKNITIRQFRELLVTELLGQTENLRQARPDLRCRQHIIAIRGDARGNSIRQACKLCYQNSRRSLDRSQVRKNVKKTTTYCPTCPKKPQLCGPCFIKAHSKYLN